MNARIQSRILLRKVTSVVVIPKALAATIIVSIANEIVYSDAIH